MPSSRQIALIDFPCLKNPRRIFAIVSTTSIPTSASKNHGSQCGPSIPGSRLDADHPEKGVLFACRFTLAVSCGLFRLCGRPPENGTQKQLLGVREQEEPGWAAQFAL